MKVWIWIGCFATVTAVNLLLIFTTGFALGWLFYIGAWYAAKKLCEAYDESQYYKQHGRTCTKCGATLEGTGAFCHKCGEKTYY